VAAWIFFAKGGIVEANDAVIVADLLINPRRVTFGDASSFPESVIAKPFSHAQLESDAFAVRSESLLRNENIQSLEG
jgi:hypothetical protein